MDREAVNQILDIQERIQSDGTLMAQYQARQRAFLSMLPELTVRQRDIIWDYLGVCVEIHLRLLALACDPKHEK